MRLFCTISLATFRLFYYTCNKKKRNLAERFRNKRIKEIKKIVFVFVMGLMMTLPVCAQWTNYDTLNTIRRVFGLANATLESAERKKEMEILARQKVEFEQSFQKAMTEGKDFEQKENWEEALAKYEEAAKLNCKYSYTDQRAILQKITSLYAKAGREDDG